MKRIGQGAFAVVYACGDYAIKRVDLHRAKRSMLDKEIAVHSALSHPSIVQLQRVEWQADFVDLYLELCETDLGRVLESERRHGTTLNKSLAKRWFAEVAHALAYLHGQQIMHRDLKPPNVLIKQNKIKLSDFGLSKVVVDMTATVCGSPLYMAPEILHKQSYSFKSDLWSLGCILHEMIYGKLFYTGSNIVSLVQNIESRRIEISEPLEWSDLLIGLLQRDEADRLTLDQVLQHAWSALSEIDLQFSMDMDLSSALIEDYSPPPSDRPLSPIYSTSPPVGLWQKTWRSLSSSLQDCAELFRDAKSV